MATSLSSSDLHRLTVEVAAIAETLSAAGREADAEQADLSTLLAAASRVYAACSSDPYGQESLTALAMTPTEACTVAAALLRSQSLTPFEFSIWFSDGRIGGGR